MFRRKYLCEKEEKKPIIKDFTTHLIKMIHKTTPQLRVADSHEISEKPQSTGIISSRKEVRILSSRRPQTCSLSRRSEGINRTDLFRSSLNKSSNNKNNFNTKETTGINISPSQKRRSRSSFSKSGITLNLNKPGCHLHISSAKDSYAKQFLEFYK